MIYMKNHFTVMKQGIGTISNRKYTRNGVTLDRFFVYVPLNVATDSQFPFEHNEKINIIIEPDKRSVRLEKIKEKCASD